MTDTPTPPRADQAAPISTDDLRKLLEAVTPGPWEAGEAEQISGHIIERKITSGAYASIARVHSSMSPLSDWYAPVRNLSSNARLIALVPQLAAELLARRADLAALSAPAEVEGLGNPIHDIRAAFIWARDARPAGYETAILKIEALLEGALPSLAALQAENERLRREGDRLELACFRQGQAVSSLQARAEKAERELAEAREKNGALIEKAIWQVRSSVPGHMLVGDTEHICAAIRALDPDATAALAARDKRVREEETRACAKIVGAAFEGMHIEQTRRAILARLGQPKAESGI